MPKKVPDRESPGYCATVLLPMPKKVPDRESLGYCATVLVGIGLAISWV
jgi:hypothetical protein